MEGLSAWIESLSEKKRSLLALRLQARGIRTQQRDGQSRSQLVAYAVARAGQQLTVDDLRGYLVERLPLHMVPTAFVMLDQLPRTPNLKIDRQSLPAPPRDRGKENGFLAPRNDQEKMLADIWSRVLGMERIGAHDDFLEIGGDSLLAMQIAARMQTSFETEVSVEDLFRCPTISELAALIDDRRQRGVQAAFGAIEPEERPERLPLSFSQERVWFLDQLMPGNIAYNAYLTIRFQGKLDVTALERTLTEIVDRHEILRTSFLSVEGQPVQQIEPPEPVELPVVDLRALPADQRQAEVKRLVHEEITRPFDVTQTPLIRWTLLQQGSETHTLIQVEHHFVHDGWTMSILLGEIKALYAAFSRGQASPLAELPLQFADFAIWQRRWMQGPVARDQQAYWKERLSGSPPLLELPADHPRPKVAGFLGGQRKRELLPQLCQSLRALSQDEHSSLFMTLLAAFKALLFRYTQQPDMVVGSGVSSRPLREFEEMLGMVLNNVVLRTDVSGDPTFRQLLARVREVTLKAYAHQHLPFEKIVDALHPERSLSYNPLYQVMFSFHDSPMPSLTFPELTGIIEYPHNGSAKFDLNVVIEPRAERRLGREAGEPGERIVVDWEYNRDLFEDSTIARMLEHYHALLEGIASDPDKRLSEYSVTSEAERQRVVVQWNDTRADYPRNSCVHHLVEARAAQMPQAVAVEFQDEQLTYDELNRRANQLARVLVARGVAPDRTVGIYLERQPETIIGLLAILKAGGAYVPLDISYPQDRLALMIADAEVSVLVTRRSLLSELPEHNANVVCLDTDRDETTRQSQENFAAGVTAENLAYVMYTSGSTGKPKGVAVPHRAVLRLLVDVSYVHLDAQETLLQMAPTSFDASTFEIWGALLHGGKCGDHVMAHLVTVQRGDRRGARGLIRGEAIIDRRRSPFRTSRPPRTRSATLDANHQRLWPDRKYDLCVLPRHSQPVG
jgi:non-ribosomal peptide synthetase component F/acyl carrier protein